jgi:hypothetical protein
LVLSMQPLQLAVKNPSPRLQARGVLATSQRGGKASTPVYLRGAIQIVSIENDTNQKTKETTKDGEVRGPNARASPRE